MKDPIAHLLATASEIYERELSPLMVAAYRATLSEYSESQLLTAFQSHLSDPRCGSFFPKPADIVRQIVAARTLTLDPEFNAIMHAVCFGGASDASQSALEAFWQATGGASTYDMRLWGYERWDRVRTAFMDICASAAVGGKAMLDHQPIPLLEH